MDLKVLPPHGAWVTEAKQEWNSPRNQVELEVSEAIATFREQQIDF